MTDEDKALVEWLREMGEHPCRVDFPIGASLRDAADRIEAQAAEIEKLREALQGVTPPAYFGESEQHKAWWAKARAALGETE